MLRGAICLFGVGKAKANPRQQRIVKRRGYQTLDGISNKLVVPYGTSRFLSSPWLPTQASP